MPAGWPARRSGRARSPTRPCWRALKAAWTAPAPDCAPAASPYGEAVFLVPGGSADALMIAAVVLFAAATASAAPARPSPTTAEAAVSQTADDPFTWLEDPDSPRALKWVKHRERPLRRRAGEGPALRGPAPGGAEDRRRHRPRPHPRVPGGTDLQPVAGLRPRAGAMAAHLAGELSHRQPRLGDGDRPGRPVQGRGQDLGVEGRGVPEARGAALHRPVVGRRRGRGGAARVRPALQELRGWRLPPGQEQAGRRLARRRHPAAGPRPGGRGP